MTSPQIETESGDFSNAQPCFIRRRRRDTEGEFEKDVNSVETVSVYPFLEEIDQLGGIKRLNEIECQKV